MDIFNWYQNAAKPYLLPIIVSITLPILLDLYFIYPETGSFVVYLLGGVITVIFAATAINILVVKPLLYARDNAQQALRDSQVQLGLLAYVDPLTQLANRRQLLEHLERVISSCIRRKVYGAVLLVDLIEFRSVNILHGIDAGDAVLVELAKRISSSIRFEDVAGRLLGDKFIVLVDHLDEDKVISGEKALRIAEKLIAGVNAPFEYGDTTLQIGAIVGVSLIELERSSADAIIRKANVALYRVKKNGGKSALFSE